MSSVAVISVVGGYLVNKNSPHPSTAGSDAAGGASQTQAQIAQDQWNYYKTNYQPLESSLIQQAQDANNPDQYAAAQGRANADVTRAYDMATKSTANRLQAYGVNPGSPAYQSAITSAGLAEGSANAGAQTQAYNQQKQLAYSKALDVVGLGRNIPAQSAASAGASAQSAGIMQNSLNSQFLQNTQNQQNIGYGLQPLVGAARSYFGSSGNPTAGQSASNVYASNNAQSGSTTGNTLNPVGVKDGGKLTERGVSRYAEGGNVTDDPNNILDMQQQPDGTFSAAGLEPMLMKKGFHPNMAKMASKRPITPHMKHAGHKMMPMQHFAVGGGVGTQGLEHAPSQMNQTLDGPGTETSDSIPAQVDGQKPAALSKGEFVMSAEVPKLSGEEILQAINRAGLQKRDMQQNPPGNSAQLTPSTGSSAYADGGEVKPQNAPIGTGMAKVAANTLSDKKQYDKEAIDAQTEGREMPSFEEWQAKKNGYARGGMVQPKPFKITNTEWEHPGGLVKNEKFQPRFGL